MFVAGIGSTSEYWRGPALIKALMALAMQSDDDRLQRALSISLVTVDREEGLRAFTADEHCTFHIPSATCGTTYENAELVMACLKELRIFGDGDSNLLVKLRHANQVEFVALGENMIGAWGCDAT